jgi:hypothetical protein
MTMQAIDPAARRPSFGRLSVWFAISIFIVTTVFFAALFAFPKKSPLQDIGSTIVLIEAGFLAPLGHLAGFVLGVVAMFRSGDRRGLGAVGALLNVVVVVVTGAILLFIAAAGLSVP